MVNKLYLTSDAKEDGFDLLISQTYLGFIEIQRSAEIFAIEHNSMDYLKLLFYLFKQIQGSMPGILKLVSLTST